MRRSVREPGRRRERQMLPQSSACFVATLPVYADRTLAFQKTRSYKPRCTWAGSPSTSVRDPARHALPPTRHLPAGTTHAKSAQAAFSVFPIATSFDTSVQSRRDTCSPTGRGTSFASRVSRLAFPPIDLPERSAYFFTSQQQRRIGRASQRHTAMGRGFIR